MNNKLITHFSQETIKGRMRKSMVTYTSYFDKDLNCFLNTVLFHCHYYPDYGDFEGGFTVDGKAMPFSQKLKLITCFAKFVIG